MDSVATLPDPRVGPEWIASHSDDPVVRFVEIDVSAAAYNAGHIPGAVLWNAYTDLRHSDYRPISAAELQELVRVWNNSRHDGRFLWIRRPSRFLAFHVARTRPGPLDGRIARPMENCGPRVVH